MTTDSTTRLRLNSASFSSKSLQPDNLFPTAMLSSTHMWSGIFLWSFFEHFCLPHSPKRLLGFTHHDTSPERVPQGYTDGHVDVLVDQHEASQGNVEQPVHNLDSLRGGEGRWWWNWNCRRVRKQEGRLEARAPERTGCVTCPEQALRGPRPLSSSDSFSHHPDISTAGVLGYSWWTGMEAPNCKS